jgi:hypothetical protein
MYSVVGEHILCGVSQGLECGVRGPGPRVSNKHFLFYIECGVRGPGLSFRHEPTDMYTSARRTAPEIELSWATTSRCVENTFFRKRTHLTLVHTSKADGAGNRTILGND